MQQAVKFIVLFGAVLICASIVAIAARERDCWWDPLPGDCQPVQKTPNRDRPAPIPDSRTIILPGRESTKPGGGGGQPGGGGNGSPGHSGDDHGNSGNHGGGPK